MAVDTDNIAFVRRQLLEPQQTPRQDIGPLAWARKNLFATPFDAVLTVAALAVIIWAGRGLVDWLFIQATWFGTDRTFCATVDQGGIQPSGWSGACWAFVGDKFGFLMFGSYPVAERWRPALVFLLFALSLAPLLMPKVPYKGWNALVAFIIMPVISFFLLHGGVFGLEPVETANWGGLLVTLIISYAVSYTHLTLPTKRIV